MEILIDCIKDTIIIFPTIFILYVIIEWISDKKIHLNQFSNLGVMIGGLLGLLPECGTSIMGAKLFSLNQISLGTLMAIFIASSDEAMVILLSESTLNKKIWRLLLLKVLLGIIIGFIVDRFWQFSKQTEVELSHDHHHEDHSIFKHALHHTMKIIAFVFISQIIISLIIAIIGEETVMSFLNAHQIFQPLIAGLIGLIPSCAGSMILAQVYLNGMLSYAALFTGLSCSTGLGLLTLYRYHTNKSLCINITLALYVISVIVGYSILFIS